MAGQTTTIFERTSALARELGAINLGQGFPDLPEPEELLEAARRALLDKPNQYPPMRGLPALRQAVCDYYRREQRLDVLTNSMFTLFKPCFYNAHECSIVCTSLRRSKPALSNDHVLTIYKTLAS